MTRNQIFSFILSQTKKKAELSYLRDDDETKKSEREGLRLSNENISR